MAKQIFNTRGMTIEEIKECLRAKIQNSRPNVQSRISRLQESLDYHLYLKGQNEEEISYLEKFIARKEKQK